MSVPTEYYIHCETCLYHYKAIPIFFMSDFEKVDQFIVDGHCDTCKTLGFHDGSIYMGDDNMGYYKFTRYEFEENLTDICRHHNVTWRDITKEARSAGKRLEERLYEVTTANKGIRVLIYSTLDLNTNTARENGGDAMRVNLWIKTEYGNGHKNFKTHNRVETIFVNLEKTFKAIDEYVRDEETITKWVRGIKYGKLKEQKAKEKAW